MFKNKMLFVFKRYEYHDNKISISKNLSFLSIISSIITRFFKSIIKNDSDENNFDINFSKNISNKKKLTLTLKIFKEKIIKKSNLINITKINALIYYYLIRNKKNKLFSLTINEIYDTSYKSFSSKTLQRDNRISFNKSYLCDFKIKYKRCYEFYISKKTQINNIKILIFQKVL